jgi:hypothetical protein
MNRDKDARDADPRNSQQDFGGNIANGHPANNVITPQREGMSSTEQGRTTVDRGAGDFSSQRHGETGRAEQSARRPAPESGRPKESAARAARVCRWTAARGSWPMTARAAIRRKAAERAPTLC